MKEKDVCITIKSTQIVNSESDTTELFTIGKMGKSGEGYSITYEESEATGFEGSNVTLSVSDDTVTMLRQGRSMSNLIIERGKKHHCHYGTEFGDFIVGINTDKITSTLTDDGGDLYLKYTIDINSSFMSQNEMFINIRENN